MTSDDIKHSKVELPESYTHRAILEEARNVLGYRPAIAGYRLSVVLKELEIETLNAEQVRDYMHLKRTGEYMFVEHRLADYKEPIPIYVLNKAIEIKKRLPDAEFVVWSYEKYRNPAGDPFLWVQVDGFGYFIEVWDEPLFDPMVWK